MSSTNFDQVVWSEENLETAFQRARTEASWSGEEGTIFDSYSTQQYRTDRPLTTREAYIIVNADIEGMSRSSASKAIPLLSSKSVEERIVTRMIKVTSKAIEEAGSLHAAIQIVAAESVTLRDREMINSINIVRDPKTHKSNITKKYKTVVETVEGKAELRYFITKNGHQGNLDWANGFKTMAEARKELTRVASLVYSSQEDVVTYEVISQTMREDGSPLLRATQKVVGAEVEVRINVLKIAKNPVRGGWLFFGWLYN
jgi:hypothetical protein